MSMILTFCGTERFHMKVICKLKNIFKISSEESSCFKYLGLQVVQNERGITVKQDGYIGNISGVKIDSKKSNATQLNDNEKSEMRSITGQISWVVGQTRPDLPFESCSMANVGRYPTIEDLKHANKTVKKMKENDIPLNIPALEDIESTYSMFY